MQQTLKQDKFKDAVEFSSRKYPNKVCWSLSQVFSFFHEILESDKFQGADFKYDNIIFKFQPKNTRITHFWSHIFGLSFIHQTLLQDKFKDTDFKYDYILFNFQTKNIQIRRLWS